jgi:hypothetical protein
MLIRAEGGMRNAVSGSRRLLSVGWQKTEFRDSGPPADQQQTDEGQGREDRPIKMLKMKVDPTMYMKTKHGD